MKLKLNKNNNKKDLINEICLGFYLLEIIFQIFSKRMSFFKKKYQIYDLFLLISTMITYTTLYLLPTRSVLEIHFKICKNFMDFLRLLRIAKKIKFLKRIFETLSYVFPEVASLLALLMIVFIIYSLIGVDLLCYLKPQKIIDGKNIHFKNFYMAFYSLLRVATGEQWFLILNDSTRKISPNFICIHISDYEGFLIYGEIFILKKKLNK